MVSSMLSQSTRILVAFLSSLLFLVVVNCYESYKSEINKDFDVIKIFSNLLPRNNLWKINEYLTQNIETDDVEENLQKVNDLLEAEKKRKSFLNVGFIRALERFVKLSEIKGANKCSMNSYSILFENNEALNDRVHKPDNVSTKSLTRVESIIYNKSLYHAIECQKTYPREYVKLMSEMDKNRIKKLHLFQDNLFSKFLFNEGKLQDDTPKSEVLEVMNQVNSLKSKKIARIAYDAIEELAHNDPDRKYLKLVFENNNVLLRTDKVKELFLKYLIEPCEYFIRELDKIFVPYNYDKLMLKPEQTYQPKCEQDFMFFISLSRHKLCKLLVEDDQSILLENVIAVAYNGGL